MNLITSLQELISILNNTDSTHHADTMKRVKISTQDLSPFATWSAHSYTRNCIVRSNDYEIILLCWDIGVKSSIHGHGGKDCWVYQVEGVIEEKRFKLVNNDLIKVKSETLIPEKISYMNDVLGYHCIENNSKRRAMTLHIYASPIDSCQVYNLKKSRFEVKRLAYDTYKGNEVENISY